AGECDTPSKFQRHKMVNGNTVDENGRAVVLSFTTGNWGTRQWVYVLAAEDPRSEGDRIVVAQHSVISNNPLFDRARVRDVQVMVRDNDTPGVAVTTVQLGTNIEDSATMVVEGSNDPAAGGAYTGTDDDLPVQLAKRPAGTDTIVVRLALDAGSQQALTLSGDPTRLLKVVSGSSTYYTISFDSTNSATPVRVTLKAG